MLYKMPNKHLKTCVKTWFVALGLLCSNGRLHAQNLSEMKFEVLDDMQGLSNYWISDVAADSAGFVWVSTRNGLNRYDGFTFKTFKNGADSHSLLSNASPKLYVQPNGTIWVSYPTGGMSKYDPGCQCFEHLKSIKPKYASDNTFGIKWIDASENIWYSGNGMGLNMLDPRTLKTTHYDLPNITEKISHTDDLENNSVHFIYPENNGSLWLATQNGLYNFKIQSARFTYFPYNETATALKIKANFNRIIPEKDEGLWISSWEGGLNYFDKKTGLFTNYLFETKRLGYYNLIFDMDVKNQDELWLISGDRGLGTFNRKTKTWLFNANIKKSIDSRILFLNHILALKNGVIFVADENALLKYNPFSSTFHFNQLNIAESQHGELFHIRKIIEYPQQNEFYFGTDLGNGLNVLNTQTKVQKAYPFKVNAGHDFKMRMRNMWLGPDDIIWILGRDYLHYFNCKLHQLQVIENPFENAKDEPDPEYNQLITADNCVPLILTQSGHLYPLNTNARRLEKRMIIADTKGIQIQKTDRAVYDVMGRLWVFGQNKIGYCLKGNSTFTFIEANNIAGFKMDIAKGFAADESGNIWIGLNDAGLLKLNVNTAGGINSKLYTTQDGLPDASIYNVAIDYSNQVWFSTLSSVIAFNQKSRQFKVYNQLVGMNKFTSSMNLLRAEQGAFYITSLGAYCKVDYQKLNLPIPTPDIYIDAFKVFNKNKIFPQNNPSEIVVKPGEDFFSFDFGCIDFTEQSHHRFAYKLEGWDREWVDAGNRRYASYTNLGAGTYTFKVKVANAEGIWSKEKSIRVKIETYFYKKTWFIILVILCIAGIIFSLYLARIKRIRKEEKTKTALHEQLAETRMEALRSQMNPHFIFNSLNSINRYIIKNDAQTSSLYLTRFAKLMRLVMDNSRHKTITLANELEALKLYIELEIFRFENKFEYTIHVGNEVETETIQIPPLIIQPFVENAIWHGLLHKEGGGKLEINIHQTPDLLLIKVSDNGIGRAKAKELKGDKNQTRNSLGIKLTEERIQFMNENMAQNTIQITDLTDENGQAAGTCVTLQIHLNHDKGDHR